MAIQSKPLGIDAFVDAPVERKPRIAQGNGRRNGRPNGRIKPTVSQAIGEDYTSPRAARASPDLSIVVPTRNEADNVAPLLTAIQNALPGQDIEVIFVDDSDDDTPEVVRKVGKRFPFAVSVLARPLERRNGLGKAVVEGIQAARADWVCVMDGDLQHPPEVIPQLMQAARESQANLVVASRLTEGGSADGLSFRRKLISYTLAVACRICFSRQARHVSDPLTGFFLVRRDALDPDRLQPEGFKILLEILVRSPGLKVAEIPFEFGERQAGESKANVGEAMRLFHQMFKLAFLSQERLLRFVMVGLSGLVVNTLLMILLVELTGVHYLIAALVATQGSTLWNFAWAERWVFKERGGSEGFMGRMAGYLVMNNTLLLLRGPLLAILISGLGVHYALANLLSLILMTLVRFAIADHLIWSRGDKKMSTTYFYNIHDLIRVRSARRLPELGYFQTSTPLDEIDLDISVVGNVSRHRQPDSIVYSDFPGRFGFNIVINQKEEKTDVFASSLIGASPHVLYTNVVEPLLRWMFVRKGYALMHGATIAFGDKALFITAQTDTGKTTTILHTIRNNAEAGRFLSDDMSILSPDGTLRSYPKPLTISQHTVHAIGGAPLSRRERFFLKVQSRLHSRGGRKVGMTLSESRMPAATLNAVVQFLIPPPKFMVDKLIPDAQYRDVAQLDHIVLIERCEDFEKPLPDDIKLDTLIANAEDAYGFPPYPVIAEQLYHWNGADLREVERDIVATAIQDTPAVHLGSSTYDWYKRLPHYVDAPLHVGASHPVPAQAEPAWKPQEGWAVSGADIAAD